MMHDFHSEYNKRYEGIPEENKTQTDIEQRLRNYVTIYSRCSQKKPNFEKRVEIRLTYMTFGNGLEYPYWSS